MFFQFLFLHRENQATDVPVLFIPDGYPMQDVIMKWKGEGESAVDGVDKVEIPQFTIVDYKCISTVESLATGLHTKWCCLTACHSGVMQSLPWPNHFNPFLLTSTQIFLPDELNNGFSSTRHSRIALILSLASPKVHFMSKHLKQMCVDYTLPGRCNEQFMLVMHWPFHGGIIAQSNAQSA
jgi:hypothetical protein